MTGGQACSFKCVYILALETKSINSSGQRVIPGEMFLLKLGQRDHTASATSSGILKAGECMEVSSGSYQWHL